MRPRNLVFHSGLLVFVLCLSLGKYFAEQITFSADSQRLAYVVVSCGENYWEGATKRAK